MSHALLAHSERVTHHLCHSPSHQLTLVVDLDERGIFHFTMTPAPNFAGLRHSSLWQVYQELT